MSPMKMFKQIGVAVVTGLLLVGSSQASFAIGPPHHPRPAPKKPPPHAAPAPSTGSMPGGKTSGLKAN